MNRKSLVTSGCALLAALVSGCVVDANTKVLVDKIDGVTQEVNALKAEINVKAGGDVNEPIAAWIMAISLGLVALTYPVGKIVWLAFGKASQWCGAA